MSGDELWYVQHGQSAAIGPVETRHLTEGIASGRVPAGALVCPVGGTAWTPAATHPAFAQVVRQQAIGNLPVLPGARDEDLDFGDAVQTQVVQSPLDVFAGRNYGPPPPPPIAAPAPRIPLTPVMPWAPQPPNAPGLPNVAPLPNLLARPYDPVAAPAPPEGPPRPYPHPAIILGIALGVSLLLAGLIILVMRAH